MVGVEYVAHGHLLLNDPVQVGPDLVDLHRCPLGLRVPLLSSSFLIASQGVNRGQILIFKEIQKRECRPSSLQF